MNYTITELTHGNAKVTFGDGSWANVAVLSHDTKESFERRVEGYVKKLPQPNPEWISANQTGTVKESITVEKPFDDGTGEDTTPTWLKGRIAEYGSSLSQIEYITECGLDEWKIEVDRIKAKYPQPE